MRRRISIRGCVRPSVRRSVGPSVRPSVRPYVPCYFQTHTRRILCRVSGLVFFLPRKKKWGGISLKECKLAQNLSPEFVTLRRKQRDENLESCLQYEEKLKTERRCWFPKMSADRLKHLKEKFLGAAKHA